MSARITIALAALVLVGDDQLGDDREDLADQPRITVWPVLEHARAALAQVLELALDAVGDDADQRADDEDAAERDGQHREHEQTLPVSPPIVPGSSVRSRLIHSAWGKSIAVRVLTLAERAGDDDDAAITTMTMQRQDEQPEDQRDRAAGHEVVERVAEPGGQG